MKLSSLWLRRYLVHLRLPNSKSYSEWAVQKDETSKFKVDNKPKEFERALSGYEYDLTVAEIEKIIEKLDIVPDDEMSAEIARRLMSWILDTDGRRREDSMLS